MGGISNAIAKAAKSYGVTISLDTTVNQFLVDNSGKIEGIQLENGTKHYSNVVLSNATPEITFNKLCPTGRNFTEISCVKI